MQHDGKYQLLNIYCVRLSLFNELFLLIGLNIFYFMNKYDNISIVIYKQQVQNGSKNTYIVPLSVN